MDKVIVIDWSIFLHANAYASLRAGLTPTWMAMNSILGNLNRIGVDEEDLIIIACDGMNNWRKDYIKQTKADRKDKKAQDGVDWPSIYIQFDDLLNQVEAGTDWQILYEDKAEADDIMAVCCRYFSDREVVILSSDSDLQQLWTYPNVKLFSPHYMSKVYKIRPDKFNISEWLAREVMNKGHNNLGKPTTEKEYDIKSKCIDLIELPELIEKIIIEHLDNLPIKGFNLGKIESPDIRERIPELYKVNNKVITYEQTKKKHLKKVEKKKKKDKEKRYQIKQEKIKKEKAIYNKVKKRIKDKI